jgi:hypothetical protein
LVLRVQLSELVLLELVSALPEPASGLRVQPELPARTEPPRRL